MILFITPIEHIVQFTKKIEELSGVFPYEIMKNPTYESVQKRLEVGDIHTLFCAPNHQDFMIDKKMLKKTNIKFIVTPSTGMNHIDVTKQKVISIKGDDVLKEIWSTAEHTLSLMLIIARKIKPAIELKDKTLGIFGYGRVGEMVEELCKPLFKKIICVDKNKTDSDFFIESDVVTIHCDLNKTTEDIVDSTFISKFDKPFYLINTARGECVDEDAVIKAIEDGKIKGYATDVIKNEYTNDDSLLIFNPKVHITPHIAGVTSDAQEKSYNRVFEIWRDNMMNRKEFEIRQKVNSKEKNYLPTGQSVDDYSEILQYIEEHKPKCIVEYGSGFSTMLIQEKIDELKLDTKFFSFEDNKHYYDVIKDNIESTQAMKLVPYERDNKNPKLGRYSHTYKGMKDVDFVIIDGPDVGRYGIHATTNAADLKKKYPKNKIKVFIQGRKTTQEWYGFESENDNAWGEL